MYLFILCKNNDDSLAHIPRKLLFLQIDTVPRYENATNFKKR